MALIEFSHYRRLYKLTPIHCLICGLSWFGIIFDPLDLYCMGCGSWIVERGEFIGARMAYQQIARSNVPVYGDFEEV